LIPTVKDIGQVVNQPHKLLTIRENATVAEAAKKMSGNQVGCLVVFDRQDKFAGVLTERDMLAKVLTASSLSPDNIQVRDIMTAEPISCTPDTTVAKVEQLMAEHKIRHVPILENGLPIAMVSSRDLIAYQLHNNSAMKMAAEQLAMLSTGLKSLDFNECPHPQEKLLDYAKMKEISKNGHVIAGKICTDCAGHGRQIANLVIPLNIHDHLENSNVPGFLCMCRFNPSNIDPEESQLYKASLLQEILSVNLTNAMLYRNYQEARRDSETDPLTSVGTRRVLEKVLKAECARAIRYYHSFSVAILDVDNLKQINDNQGHAAGDRTLQQLAKIMQENLRETDIIITRYGGDEFVLVMPETKLKGAKVLLERLRRQTKTISIPNIKSVTISTGLVEWNQGPPPDNAQTILERADTALYEAKRKGRNRVVTSQSHSK